MFFGASQNSHFGMSRQVRTVSLFAARHLTRPLDRVFLVQVQLIDPAACGVIQVGKIGGGGFPRKPRLARSLPPALVSLGQLPSFCGETDMFGVGGGQLLLLSLVVLLLFGHKLPSTMRSLGQSMRSFREGMEDGETTRLENK